MDKKNILRKARVTQDMVRRMILAGASDYRIVLVIAERCKAAKGGYWIHATIAQTQQVLGIPLSHARALVSEFTGQKTSI